MATKKLIRPTMFQMLSAMDYMRNHATKLQAIPTTQVVSMLREDANISVSVITVRKIAKQLNWPKRQAAKKIFPVNAVGPRIGRIEVIVGELLMELDKQGLKVAGRLLEELGKRHAPVATEELTFP